MKRKMSLSTPTKHEAILDIWGTSSHLLYASIATKKCLLLYSPKSYPKVCWDSAMGDMELGPALVPCSYKHHNELLGLQLADPFWATKSNFWPRPSLKQYQYVPHEFPLEALPID